MADEPSMAPAVDLRVLSPVFCDNTSLSGCVAMLAEHVQSKALRIDCWVPGARPEARRDFTRSPLPHLLTRAVYKVGLEAWLLRKLEASYRNSFGDGDVAWVWPGTSVEVFEWLKERGHRIVLERINSCQATAARILSEAYAELGLPADHPISTHKIEVERRKLELADFVFCPSPWTRQTYVDAGVPEAKILDTSYGWDPETFAANPERPANRQPPTFLFVGSGDVRKGLPWLLRAWEKAAVDGRLVITGNLEPAVETLCRDILNRDDVIHIPHTGNLVPLYESADAFVLPSVEEGSPLVGYLALAAGLPCLVSPPVASGVVRHDVEGLVHPTEHEDGWIASLRLLARDYQLRARMSSAARARAMEFTWQAVGERRRSQLENALCTPTAQRQPAPTATTARHPS